MPLKLPRLQSRVAVTDRAGLPDRAFHQWWDNFARTLETAVNDLADSVAAIAAAQAAADAANAAAAAADAAALAAQGAADDAAATSSLANSGVTGATITATDAGADATITISAHTRVYGDGTTVSVNGGSITGRAYSTLYYIYYDQASRAGGAVTYLSTTSESTAAQTGDRHLVGVVTTPAAAAPDTGGDYVGAPGLGSIIP